MTALAGSQHDGEYPQAIADDYPGWTVTRGYAGRWTAACPAVTAADLRAEIEHAITGDDP